MPYPYAEIPRQEIEVFGIKTSFRSAGQSNNPLVVLLHGTVSSSDAYREVMHELSGEFWLIAPDLPGFGLSGDTEPYTLPHLVEWLASFRELLNLPEMMLVGHSFGGALAASYTISYPEDVSRLLLIAPAILASELLPDSLKRLGLSLGLVDLGAALAQSPSLLENQTERPFYDPDTIDESVWPRRLVEVDQSRAAGGVLRALAFQDMTPELHKITQAVCIIWGENDPVLPVTHGEQIANYLPDVQLEIWDKCGHVPQMEDQQRFLSTAHRFFRGK